jgi:hypothetical protein
MRLSCCRRLSVPALLFALLPPVSAVGIEDRYRRDCFACHDEAAYTRAERRIDSHPALVKRVRGCTRAVGGDWSEAEITALVELLEARFYRFP